LKLPLLLTQFLYKHKRLSLPGIGDFTLDPSAIIPDQYNKDPRAVALGIEFKSNLANKPDEELIDFIRVHTGKMRPLAMADLDSYLTLGTELLNIGKPFYLEGIGTLTKNKEGQFEFTPGEYAIVKMDDEPGQIGDKLARKKHPADESHHQYQADSQGNRSMKWLLAVAIVAGLSLVGWGGYVMYKRNAPRQNETNSFIGQIDSAAVKSDSSQGSAAGQKDSPAAKFNGSKNHLFSGDSVLYKYVILQTYDKARALKRYNQLLSYDLKINLFTKDSSFFKVYFAFPTSPKDTVHIKDSLFREYAHSITIER
jgi:hypothetical protein